MVRTLFGPIRQPDSPGQCWFSPSFLSVWPRRALSSRPTPQPLPAPPPATLLPGIEVLATTYLWFPWTAVGVRPANTNLPSASTTIGPGDLYSHLTWVPFMGQAELRSGPFGVVTDFIHAPLKSGVTTGEVLFGGGTANFTINTGSAVFLYRALAS